LEFDFDEDVVGVQCVPFPWVVMPVGTGEDPKWAFHAVKRVSTVAVLLLGS
jgi:hypothetical protein